MSPLEGVGVWSKFPTAPADDDENNHAAPRRRPRSPPRARPLPDAIPPRSPAHIAQIARKRESAPLRRSTHARRHRPAVAAFTIATIPARSASGSIGQAATIRPSSASFRTAFPIFWSCIWSNGTLPESQVTEIPALTRGVSVGSSPTRGVYHFMCTSLRTHMADSMSVRPAISLRASRSTTTQPSA